MEKFFENEKRFSLPVRKSAIIEKRSEVEGGMWSLSPEPPLSHAERSALMKQYSSGPRVDWGEALDVSLFYGRTSELAQLTTWVVQERCRIVSVLGMGGIGKSALAMTFMHQMASSFQAVVFRSVRDAPACMDLLTDCSASALASASADEALQHRAKHRSAAGVLPDAALSACAGQPGNAVARARFRRPHACGLRRLRNAAAPGG